MEVRLAELLEAYLALPELPEEYPTLLQVGTYNAVVLIVGKTILKKNNRKGTWLQKTGYEFDTDGEVFLILLVFSIPVEN